MKDLIKKDGLHKWKGLERINIKYSEEKGLIITFLRVQDEALLIPFTDLLVTKLRDIQGIKLVCAQ